MLKSTFIKLKQTSYKKSINQSMLLFFISIALMFITHGFCFTNIMFSHDSAGFAGFEGDLYKVSLGRWAYPAVVWLRHFATPWLVGVLSTIFVSISVVIVTDVLSFNLIQGVCVSIIFSTNLTLTALFGSYIYDADAYCLALMLACFAVYAYERLPRILNFCISVISMVICTAIYQTYLSVSIGLFLFLMIIKVKKIKKYNDFFALILEGIKILLSIAIAMIIYFVILRISPYLYHIQFSDQYNGVGKLSDFSVKMILDAIPATYQSFTEIFSKLADGYGIANSHFTISILVLIFISILLCLFEPAKFKSRMLIALTCVLFLPLALNTIYIVSDGVIHYLMTFAINLFFLLPLVFFNVTEEVEKSDKKIVKFYNIMRNSVFILSSVIILIIGLQNIVYSNGAYVYKKLVYDNTVLHAHSIWRDINSIKEYNEGETKVIIMGNFEDSKAAYHSPIEKRYYGQMIGMRNSAITYDLVTYTFYNGIMGKRLNIDSNVQDVFEWEEFKEMPCYPKQGYCKMIGDAVVVKLSD